MEALALSLQMQQLPPPKSQAPKVAAKQYDTDTE